MVTTTVTADGKNSGATRKLAAIVAAGLSLAVASNASAQVIQAAKPVAVTTANIALQPTVAFEPWPGGGRKMTVTMWAPTAEATLGWPADVRRVEFRTEGWYCEIFQKNAATGTFVGRVRVLLESYLAGNRDPALFDMPRRFASDSLNHFAAYTFQSLGSRLQNLSGGLLEQGSGTEFRYNDCYTTEEMQAIKSEVVRILGPASPN